MRERVADLGYALGWRVAGSAPAPWVGAAFRAGADLAARRGGAGPRQLRANLARVLARDGVPPPGPVLDAAVRDGLRSYARYWTEAFRLSRVDPLARYAAADRSITGTGHLDDALAPGRGVIIGLTHSGNWDVAGTWLVEALRRRGEPASLTTVAERLRPESVYRRFLDYREALGFEVLPAQAGARTIATLAARLRANRVVCLLADRELGAGGVEVDLFGEPATLPGGPAQLARHTGAALLPFGGWFTPGGWGLRFRPPVPVPAPGRGERAGAAVRATTQALADVFAADIAEHPVDWHMLQPVWTADRARAGLGVPSRVAR
ncbi:MAG TPA: phosphatidylinositol mannoside acyltransferase [Pseudonocardia sp.]|jgi:KDO2-lipid IV(A) lauroyltransferase